METVLKDTIDSAQQISPGHRLILERSAPVNVNADRHRLEQVIVNLLSNAVKYSPEADKVLVWSELKGNKVFVTIKDFGIGISKKNLDGLFDRYYRIEGSEYRFQGLGLGLFISSEILKRHGGSISVQSEPGKGSEFTFELPAAG
jgi:signal transduction histidine kinase